MPELPEVELVARTLDRLVKGSAIVNAHLLRPRLAPETTPRAFARFLKNASVNFVHRRGKHVLFDLDNGRTLITHLRMSGKFMLLPAERELPKFTHAFFELSSGEHLIFQDQRHFGLMKIVKTAELNSAKEIAKLAPEPFSDEFSSEFLRNKLIRSKRTIKEFLLDQTKVCGLGNIYASEALFLSKISPRRRADRVKRSSVEPLHDSILRVLGDAIELAGTVNVDPEDIGGSIYGNGSADIGWKVYDRNGEACARCGSPILRLKQGGRSTYYCRVCQIA
ncbi:MAG TPA: bifunctional DNA-formamidopyrimidine glycosylase/DNA-(apurinic or apyrimidinic site) lyase [Pyrinomonadaceae bacterium]|nr:bifunctional DNA-formamidopyrimidine glycosylase/DNA-(apurinic or apyrimidinic site) lyase [Pyrinomonadaceae bacterium]